MGGTCDSEPRVRARRGRATAVRPARSRGIRRGTAARRSCRRPSSRSARRRRPPFRRARVRVRERVVGERGGPRRSAEAHGHRRDAVERRGRADWHLSADEAMPRCRARAPTPVRGDQRQRGSRSSSVRLEQWHSHRRRLRGVTRSRARPFVPVDCHRHCSERRRVPCARADSSSDLALLFRGLRAMCRLLRMLRPHSGERRPRLQLSPAPHVQWRTTAHSRRAAGTRVVRAGIEQ